MAVAFRPGSAFWMRRALMAALYGGLLLLPAVTGLAVDHALILAALWAVVVGISSWFAFNNRNASIRVVGTTVIIVGSDANARGTWRFRDARGLALSRRSAQGEFDQLLFHANGEVVPLFVDTSHDVVREMFRAHEALTAHGLVVELGRPPT